MNQPTSKLVHVLLGKSLVETLLVGALAVGFFVNAFPPHFRGWGEVIGSNVAGWAVNNSSPGSRVVVQLFIDGNFVTQGQANTFRPDVRNAGWANDEWHGYVFSLPPLSPGNHVARVYAVHESGGGDRQTLQMLGDPIHFVVSSDGQVSPLK